MAPKGHWHHPYRLGPQTGAWYAGGLDPPPNRSILVIVDYPPLQGLFHHSEHDFRTFEALNPYNFRYASTGEQEALFTWSQLFPHDTAGAVQIANLRTQISNRLRTQWDIRMVPSDLELRYVDLGADVFQVRTDSTILQVLEEYRPEWRIKQYNFVRSSPLVPGSTQPFIFRLTCHRVWQGAILP